MAETNEQQTPNTGSPGATETASGASTASAVSAFSDQLANAVEQASRSIVTVAARPRQSASGVLWRAENGQVVILTADHVVEREDDINVTLPDGRAAKAQLVGRDPSTDLAVLKLKDVEVGAANPAITLNENLRVGNLALAIGRPAEGGPRVSFGVVSSIEGKQRSWQGGEIEGIIFADVTLFPGFSGGPLVDLDGKLVGLNSSRLTRQSAALPIATLRRVVNTLLTHGRVRRGYLGVGAQQVPLPAALAQKANTQQESALLVVTVEGGSPAEQAGLLLGDLIYALGDRTVTSVEELRGALSSDQLGQNLTIKILRGGEPRDLSATIAERA